MIFTEKLRKNKHSLHNLEVILGVSGKGVNISNLFTDQQLVNNISILQLLVN